MYSVTDVAGLNRISRQVLGNAANAIAGMVANPIPASATDLPAIGLTMFGVTTPLVTQLVDALKARYDPLVFHATGTGGQSMEKLVDSGNDHGVLDMTTTEVADYLVGRRLPAGSGPARRDRPHSRSYVGSVRRARHGQLRSGRLGTGTSSPTACSMCTTPGDVDAHDGGREPPFGKFIAAKLNDCEGPVRFLLPEGGVSLLDASGQPFFDPEADEALFTTIEAEVEQTGTGR